MTATDELRRLLDERGMEWEMPIGIMSHIKTVWRSGLWEYTAIETSGGEFSVYVEHRSWLTAEQVVDATLGRGTCHIVKTWSDSDYDEDWRYRCSECGCFIGVNERDPETGDVISADNYCPNCGREVVE